MRCANVFLFFIILFLIYDFESYDFVNQCPKSLSYQHVCLCIPKLEFPKLFFCDIMAMFAVGILIIYLLFTSFLYCSYTVRYVNFSSNLSTLNKKSLLQNQILTNLAVHLLYFIVLSISFEPFFVLTLMMSEIDIFHINLGLHIFF